MSLSAADDESGVATFDEPRRIAVQHEVFDDNGDIEESRWVEQRDTVSADRVDFSGDVIAFVNTNEDDGFFVSAENFIAAWTPGSGGGQ